MVACPTVHPSMPSVDDPAATGPHSQCAAPVPIWVPMRAGPTFNSPVNANVVASGAAHFAKGFAAPFAPVSPENLKSAAMKGSPGAANRRIRSSCGTTKSVQIV